MDFDINQRMSVSLSPNFTTVKIVLPKIKPLDQEELMISTEWLKENCTRIYNDIFWHNLF